ncbi:MAG: hypothetical protein ACOYVG_15085 [Bacteroidota bacterium]
MTNFFTTIFFCLLTFYCNAQNYRIDSLKRVLTKTTTPLERYKLLAEIANGYYTNGVGENSVANNLEMLRIALKQKDDSLIAVSYNRAGDYYLFEKGDFNTSLDYLFKGIPYAERANNKRSLSSLYIDISLVNQLTANFPEQLKFLKKAEANLPDAGNLEYNYMFLQLKVNMAGYYLFVGKPETALPYLNAANETNLKLNYSIFDLYIKTQYGNLNETLGDKELATVYYKKALAEEKNFFPFARFIFKNSYIVFLINSGDYTTAEIQAKELLNIGNNAQNNYFKFIATGYLKKIFDNQNKIDSAYYYSKQELSLRDTIFSQERINKAQALAFNEEVRLADEQNKKKEEADQRKQNIQYALIAIGIIILLTLYLLLSRSFITNSKLIEFFGAIALLIVFEFLNLLLHPFLEKITHHSPVLMLLALVCIAALLVPLHHKVKKWATVKLVEKNKQIRLAAAKKTIQQLDTKLDDKSE